MIDDHNDLAGEYALGVLTGEELRQAREHVRTDPSFRAEVELWTGRFSPLLEETAQVSPPSHVWNRINAAVPAPGASTNVVQLDRRVTIWRSVAGAMTALAACLAILLVMRPTNPIEPRGPPMVARLGDNQHDMKLMASWNPSGRQLVLVAIGEMPGDPKHAHELWIIPAGGKPRSLGTMPAAKMHMRVADSLASLMREGATIAVTVEPRGGSPTGNPTGPMVASGELENT